MDIAPKKKIFPKMKCSFCGCETELKYITPSQVSPTGIEDHPRCGVCLAKEMGNRLKEAVGPTVYTSKHVDEVDRAFGYDNQMSLHLERLDIEIRRSRRWKVFAVSTDPWDRLEGDVWIVRIHNPILELTESWTLNAITPAALMNQLESLFRTVFPNGEYPRRLVVDEDD